MQLANSQPWPSHFPFPVHSLLLTFLFLLCHEMTRISSGSKKSGPPAHANKFAYTHNRNSKLTRTILSFPISGLCPSCREIVEWRKRFRKYKPLTVAKKCVRCEQKRIKEAYHVVCNHCAAEHQICAKCLKSYNNDQNTGLDQHEVHHGALIENEDHTDHNSEDIDSQNHDTDDELDIQQNFIDDDVGQDVDEMRHK